MGFARSKEVSDSLSVCIISPIPLLLTRSLYPHLFVIYVYSNGECTPIGRFAWHTDQITSVEWDPNDESSLAVASADNQV